MKKIVLSIEEIRKMKRRMEVLERQMAKIGPVMRGTIVTNGKKHPQPYFSMNKDGRTHLMYLGASRVDHARKLAENYKKLIGITEEMSSLNMALLKNDAL
jgi:hypothetical protein